METNAAETIPVAHSPLPTTREERGRQIAKLGGIRQIGSRYVVPAQSGAASSYVVDLVEESCSCPDHECTGASPTANIMKGCCFGSSGRAP